MANKGINENRIVQKPLIEALRKKVKELTFS